MAGLHQAHELEATELRLGALASCRRSQAGLMQPCVNGV